MKQYGIKYEFSDGTFITQVIPQGKFESLREYYRHSKNIFDGMIEIQENIFINPNLVRVFVIEEIL